MSPGTLGSEGQNWPVVTDGLGIEDCVGAVVENEEAAVRTNHKHCVIGAQNGDQEDKTEELMGAVKRLLRRG